MAGRSSDIAPAYSAVAVTPSDVTIIPTTRGLYVGTTGNIAVQMASGVSVTFTSVAVGLLPIQVNMVKSASTTASNIVALY